MTADSLNEFLANISEDGTHACVVDKASTSVSQATGRSWVVFTYTVTDEFNELDGEEFQEFIEDFSHVTLEEYKEMTGQDKKKLREAKQRLKERLVTLGIPEEDAAGFTRYEILIGKNVSVTIETSVSAVGRKFVNIRNVSLME